MADTTLSQWEQLTQNVGMGPHVPVAEAPSVWNGEWTERDWARHYGLDLPTYRLVQRIEQVR